MRVAAPCGGDREFGRAHFLSIRNDSRFATREAPKLDFDSALLAHMKMCIASKHRKATRSNAKLIKNHPKSKGK